MVRIPVLVLFLLTVLSDAPAGAQTAEAESGRNLEHVRVRFLDNKRELRGSFLELKPESVAVLVEGRRVELPLAEVRRIEVGRDSVANGALIGALIGGAWCAFVCGQGLSRTSELPPTLAAIAGVGAWIGASIDRAHPHGRTIYPAPSSRAGRRVMRPAIKLTVRF